MLPFLGRRVLQAIPVLIGITLVAFLLIRLVPGDPARIVLGPKAPESSVELLRHQLGLTQSVPRQYLDFVSGAAHLDFGDSVTARQSVTSVLGPRIWPSLFLIGYSLLVAVAVALPLAVLSAVRRNRVTDHVVRVFTMVTFAMPSFWLGLLLVLLLSLQLGILPSSGYGETFPEHLKSLTIPAITVGLYLAPVLVRSLRSSIVETLGSEFIEASRARGFSERRVLFKHVLRNSLISTLTILSVSTGGLLSGTVVVENVFSIPGLGSLLVTSVSARDFPIIQALTLVFGLVVVFVSLATDVIYAAVDPRVRL